jgi:hypothetical protein
VRLISPIRRKSTNMDPTSLPQTLTAVTAAGAAVTGLTEVAKQYISEDRLPPPIISGTIAALFTALWEVSQPVWPMWADAFTIGMIWFGLFQSSIAIYHLARISDKSRAGKRRTIIEVPAAPPSPGSTATTEVTNAPG